MVAALNEIEAQHDVTQWKLNDLHYWPLLKNLVFFSWHKAFELSINPCTISKKKSKGGWRFRLNYLLAHLKKKIFTAIFFLKAKRIQTDVLFAGAFSHRVPIDGKFLNRYFDPLIREDSRLKYGFIEYGSTIKKQLSQYPAYQNFLLFGKFSRRNSRLRKKLTQQFYEVENIPSEVWAVLSTIITLTPEKLKAQLLRRLIAVEENAQVFSRILTLYRPKFVMMLYYYGNDMYGLTLAAKRSRIPSIDMQHGGLSNIHIAYSGFEKIPQGGYTILPDYFWCWDEISEKVINTSNHFQNFHTAFTGGNPWHQFALKNGVQQQYSIHYPGKKIILYTLQYSILDEFILDAIRKLKEEYIWLLRMHPRKIHEQSKIVSQLKAQQLSAYVEIEKATSFPLPQLMLQADIHLSKFSGSINESLALGLPTIVIDQIGYLQFEQEIKEGRLSYYDTNNHSEDLTDKIQKLTTKSKTRSTQLENHSDDLLSMLTRLESKVKRQGNV